MRLAKMLGLAMVAATAMMAFIGVSSASATLPVVCHLEAGSPGDSFCPAGKLKFSGAILGLGEGFDTFLSGFVRVECQGHMEGEVEAATLHLGTIKKVVWSNCKNNIGCTTTSAAAEALPWTFHLLAPTGNEGLMHVLNVLGSFTLTGGFCGASTKCFYTSGNVLPVYLNHNGATVTSLHAKELPLSREAGSSALCSATGKWDALYKLTPGDLSVLLKKA